MGSKNSNVTVFAAAVSVYSFEIGSSAGLSMDAPADEVAEESEITIPDGCATLDSPVTGSVWKIDAKAGTRIASGAAVLILEAMKMEVALEADEDIEIVRILVTEGASVKAGQSLVIARPSNP